MGNKEDWEELERWQENAKQKQKERFKLDFSEIDKNKEHKRINTIVNVLKITGKTIKAGEIAIVIIVIAIVLFIFNLIISNLNSKINVDPEKTIESMYHTKVDLVSKDVDDKENGKYIFKVSDNDEIQFTAIRKYGSLSEDYTDNCHKYYFNKWENEAKSIFVVNENKIGDILEYDTYIEINTAEDLDKSMSIINDFVNYCGSNFSASWRVYLKKGDYTIYPYQQDGITQQEARENAEKIFRNIVNK